MVSDILLFGSFALLQPYISLFEIIEIPCDIFICQLVKTYSSSAPSNDLNFSRPSIGICPKCGKKIIALPRSYSCESGKDGCGFVIWKTIAGKEITPTQAEKLLTKGKTDLMKGLVGKSGKKFDARLKLNKSTSVIEFEFDNKGGNKR